MMPRGKLLCVSVDPLLLGLRMRLLSPHYDVSGLSDPSRISQANTQQIELVVLCHTLSAADRQFVISIARQRWPAVKLLAVSRSDSEYLSGEVDAQVGALDGPLALLRAVAGLVEPSKMLESRTEAPTPIRSSGVEGEDRVHAWWRSTAC